jgi:glutamate-ammonia-ligase adenylyltransferase
MSAFSHLSSGALPPAYEPARGDHLVSDLVKEGNEAASDERFAALLRSIAGNSPYLSRLIRREKDYLGEIYAVPPAELLSGLNDAALGIADAPDLASAMRDLRVAKRRAALEIAFADIAGLFELDAVTGALTTFADACVKGALRFLLRNEAKNTFFAEYSAEKLEAESGLFILAMGKHGAYELNYSSDIDLIAFYEEDRFPYAHGGDKRRAAVELIKGLVKILSEVTSDGYAFRVDLRLRPDAGATQVAISAEAAEDYYEQMGQNWERAAMIKARPCAGDMEAADRFQKNLVPFIWRKYLDFAAIQDIQSIKQQIHAHFGHENIAVLGHNLKLGRGGIREIEFFAQTQQLILGGRDPSLRSSRTLEALNVLSVQGHVSRSDVEQLSDSYVFLRMLEHRLQMIEDQQTHELPKTREGLDHVARFSGFAVTEEFQEQLVMHLRRVAKIYAELFGEEERLSGETGSLVFTGVEDDPETIKTLTEMGFSAPSVVAATVRGWHHGRIRATRTARAREILTKLMPVLLRALSNTADPQAAFMQIDRFLQGLPAGVQVFSLLQANPELLNLIAEIAGSAPRLADHLGKNPGVLDALIDADFMTEIPDRTELEAKFEQQRMQYVGYEGALDAARRFAREEMFRIGAQIISGTTGADRAGPAYAAVAETIIRGLQPVVEDEVAESHGRIPGGAFVVLALGKLGGREMTAGSDLDLVFVYAHDPDARESDGRRPLSPGQYFARTSQRFIAALTALTTEGRLYEVDMRLRPSGNQGPVAVSLASFIEYHESKSWTWERMALTRARVLSGPDNLRKDVEAVIERTLSEAKDCTVVMRDAREMREKIASQFPGKEIWDLKFAPGGLVDIEFIAQSLQLCFANRGDVLDQNTSGALHKLRQAGVLNPEDAETLIRATQFEHALTHILRIALDGPFKPSSASPGLKALLARAVHNENFDELETALALIQKDVRSIFERICR